MSHRGMQHLVKLGYLKSNEGSDFEFCENCVYGKAHRVSFATGKHVSKGVLDYIHSDLWGSPNVPESLGRCQYFLSLIDDHSRKVWIYFLRTKDQAFEKFQEWVTMVERQTGRKVKKLRTDNGLEFCNRDFDSYCQQAGIVRHKSIPYTPQQNGVAERMNRTILEKVRSFLAESGLSQGFWAEAANTAVYLINRSPSTAVDLKIPEEIWTGHKISYADLKRFGSICYVHTDDGKLNPRAKRGVFLGYPFGVKGYKIWIPEDHKSVVSRNVVFTEELTFKDLSQSLKPVSEEQNSSTNGNQAVPEDISDKLLSLDHQSEKETQTNSLIQPESTETEVSDEEDEAFRDNDQNWRCEESTSGLEHYLLARDRSRRQCKPNQKYLEGNSVVDNGVALISFEDGDAPEPETFEAAMSDRHKSDWKIGMEEEMDSLHKNQTWVVVPKPANRKVIGCRWIFKRKPGIAESDKPRFKARLVAKGYSQREGVDYTEIFAPVVKHVSIRLLFSIAVQEDLEVEQLDVKTAFLHGDLDEEIFMSQPEGYEIKGKEDHVCLLKKSLYGLKQSPRMWNKKFNDFMIKIGFCRSSHDSCAYTKEFNQGEFVYLLLYVDDMIIASKNSERISQLKIQLNSVFDMKDLGPVKKILGINVERDRDKNRLVLSQQKYLEKVLKTFGMENAKTVMTPIGVHLKLQAASDDQLAEEEEFMKTVPYANAVGSIMYAMIGTRPDLAHAVGVVSRYMAKPIRSHWNAVKWVLRYLRGATEVGLVYEKSQKFEIQGFCDSDFAGDLDKRRSVTGYAFKAGSCLISWKSGLQRVVALSTTEAEYIAMVEAVKEGMWLRGLFEDFGFKQSSVEINCDSQSAIALSKNNVHHERTKHIDVKFHFIREKIAEGMVLISKVHTSVNQADVFTKLLPTNRFKELLSLLGIRKA